MKSNIKYITNLDLIGKEISAKHKYNKKTWKDYQNIGIVIDETKNMLITKKHKKIKKYVKIQYKFRCWVPLSDQKRILIEFDGKNIQGTPAERIKKIKKPRRKLH